MDLVITDIPRDSVVLGQAFTVSFKLTISALLSPSPESLRLITLAVQHVQPASPDPDRPQSPTQLAETTSPRVIAIQSTSPLQGTPKTILSPIEGDALHYSPIPADAVLLPPPYAAEQPDSNGPSVVGVTFVGPSAVFLPSIPLRRQELEDKSPVQDTSAPKVEASQRFELTYIPVRKGFVTMCGLRVFLVGDKVEGVGAEPDFQSEVRKLREWDVIGEVWVKTP